MTSSSTSLDKTALDKSSNISVDETQQTCSYNKVIINTLHFTHTTKYC